MRWNVERIVDGSFPFRSDFDTDGAANHALSRMGPVIGKGYRVVAIAESVSETRAVQMINEGLTAGDLRDILLPMISVDVYVPSDPDSDNVVLGWYIKGVPEAVIPFKTFMEYCNGVIDVDYGDCETIPECSLVYVEMSRSDIQVDQIVDMVNLAGRLSGLKPDDFTITLPSTTEKFPFDPKVLEEYFSSRDAKKDQAEIMRARQKAEAEQNADNNTTPAPSNDSDGQVETSPESVHMEHIINRLVNAIRG